ncbi:hypothetical protein [Helicobacter sp. T3_23-1059]
MFKFFVGFIVVILLMAGYFSGIIPYYILFPLQPSYWEFKKLCKLNELPNNEEKYNKILAYYGISLDTINYDLLNKNMFKLQKIAEYRTDLDWVVINYRTKAFAIFYTKDSIINRNNISNAEIVPDYKTFAYYLDTESYASYNLEWRERSLNCKEVLNKGKQ